MIEVKAERLWLTPFFSEVIEYLPRIQAVFTEMWRILRSRGILIIGTPDYGRWL